MVWILIKKRGPPSVGIFVKFWPFLFDICLSNSGLLEGGIGNLVDNSGLTSIPFFCFASYRVPGMYVYIQSISWLVSCFVIIIMHPCFVGLIEFPRRCDQKKGRSWDGNRGRSCWGGGAVCKGTYGGESGGREGRGETRSKETSQQHFNKKMAQKTKTSLFTMFFAPAACDFHFRS